MNHWTIGAVIRAIALLSVITTPHAVNAAEELLLDGSISSAQGADNYSFRQGFPLGDTATNTYRNSLTRRAIEAYKTFLPTIATEAVFQQMRNAGGVANKVGISMDQGPRQQFAATNSDTPYSFAILDLREGPMVVNTYSCPQGTKARYPMATLCPKAPPIWSLQASDRFHWMAMERQRSQRQAKSKSIHWGRVARQLTGDGLTCRMIAFHFPFSTGRDESTTGAC